MSTRSFLICFGLVVGLLVALSVLQRKEPGTERGARESRRITDLPVREAERIELTGPKGTFIFRKKAEKEWQLEKPIVGGADMVSVEKLLREIQFVETLQRLPEGKKEESLLQSFGLGQPTRTVKVGMKEGELQIETGRETPIAGGIYVRVRQSGRPEVISVVQKQLAEAMDRDLTEWREKRVLPFPVGEVEEILLHQGALEVEIGKKDGEWLIRKPVEAPADPAAVGSVLGELSTLKAVSFVSDTGGDLALYGLNAPGLVLDIRSQGTHRTLQIGQVNPQDKQQVFARVADQPSVFLLPRATLDALGKMADRVRDKRLVTFSSPAQVQSVEFAGRGGAYRLERGQGTNGWKLRVGGKERIADSARVGAWLEYWEEARANRFLSTEDPARMGLSKPRQTTTFSWSTSAGSGGSTNRVETLKFGDELKEEVFAQLADISGGIALPMALWRSIPETPWNWLSQDLMPADLGTVTGVIWASGGVRREYRAGGDGRWRAEGAGADVPEAAGYAARLGHLEVMRWTGEPRKADFTKSEVEIVVEGEKGKKVKVVVGRAAADGSAPVHVEGAEFAGLLSQSQVAKLKQDPRLPSPAER